MAGKNKIDVVFREAHKAYHGSAGGQARVVSAYAFAELFDRIRSLGYAFEGPETQRALAAGARAMATWIRKKLEEATGDPDEKRVARSTRRFENYRPLKTVIKGGEGKPEYFPSGLLLLRGKGARQAWLVDRGHAGPKPGSPRTPAHPFVFEGIAASEKPRDQAILRSYQRQFGDIARKVRAGKVKAPPAGKP